MSLTHKILNVLCIVTILYAVYAPMAHGQENRAIYYYYPESTSDDWPSIYYVFFGTFVAALVLFIMSVMTKPDDLP